MECPKCHSIIDDNATVCPKCHKVLSLECPNCHSLSDTPVCAKCGYTILVKCAKCGKLNPVTKENCPKCGLSVKSSLAVQECESDDFASIIIKFNSLKNIRRQLKSAELYPKFYFKLKNLLMAQVKNVDCKFITYGDVFAVNFNKELSFATSSNKAVRLALKIVNTFSEVNSNIIEEFGIPLNLNLTIIKKSAESLQELTTYETNVKPLVIKKDSKKYLKGMQVVLDQYVCDEVHKDYKTDSLYSIEDSGKTIVFYEVILDSYVLPPSEKIEEAAPVVNWHEVKQVSSEQENSNTCSFNTLDINAKCSFQKADASSIIDKLQHCDLNSAGKIISIKSNYELAMKTSDLVDFYEQNEYRVLYVNCTEEMNFKPWGVFETLFKDYFNIPFHNRFITSDGISENLLKAFKPLFDFVLKTPLKASTPEDARFAYMEQWGRFLSILKKTVIIIDGFEYLDDTTIQTLELYFDKFKKVVPNFVFVSSNNLSVHSKIKGLLRTPLYTEFELGKTTIETCLSLLKSDAADFINSFYFEKIKENFAGSYLYVINAIEYLKETGVLIDFENKLLIKTKKSVIISKDLKGIYKARMKHLSRNIDLSFILAYSAILNPRLDLNTLNELGIKDVPQNVETLINSGFVRYNNGILHVNNFPQIVDVIKASLKKEAEAFLAKNVLARLGKGLDDSNLAVIMGKLDSFKEEYLVLWRNSQFAIATGDYDAYLKNCLGFLTLVEHIEGNLTKEQLDENKKEVYNNILMCLYGYSPVKIYFIENILLMDALEIGDDEKIVKLSNLMLQGALITSNYTDALALLHNIFSRMPSPVLIVDGAVNTKFLLLSLVNMEILYNIGNFRECVEAAEEILKVLSVDILEKIKPASFSVNLFVSHLLETFRLAGFAKLYLMDNDLEEFLSKVKKALDVELPEQDCILALKEFLAGKVYLNGNVEEYSAFSKVIFLILQELSNLKDDYKTFAQNIYQAKLLALEIHQKEIELYCDLLIAYAYSKIGMKEKALAIYSDILKTAENSSMFNIMAVAKYLTALISPPEKALLIVNDTLAMIQKYDNQAKILYVMFEKLYIQIAQEQELSAVDIEAEEEKIKPFSDVLTKIYN